jgi:hypothetical protein
VDSLDYIYIHEIYVQIRQTRWHYQTGDICQAYYCITATSSGVLPPPLNAWVSWYWKGTSQGNPPYHPCSNDGYTPTGEDACDQSVHDPAIIPGCKLDFIPISLLGL